MRENPPFEVRLDRFGACRAAAAIVAFLAIAALSGWATSTAAARAGDDVTRVFAVAAPLAMATLAAVLLRGGLERGRRPLRGAPCSSSRLAVASAQTAPPAE